MFRISASILSGVGALMLTVSQLATASVSVSPWVSTRITYTDPNPAALNDTQSFTRTDTTVPDALTPGTVSSTLSQGVSDYAYATATASEGVFHAYATSTHEATNDSTYSESVVKISASDGMILGANLAPGTPVSELFTINLSGTDSTASCGSCGGGFSSASIANFMVYDSSSQLLGLNYYSTNPAASTLTGIVNGLAGEAITFNYYFELDTYVNGSVAYQGNPTATEDYSNTVYYHIDSLTSGATNQSTSGYDYSTASVPEPGNYALMLSGMGLVGYVVRRKKPKGV